MLVAFLLMMSPIRGLARLGAVARHATPATNQVTRLGEVRVVGAEVAHAAGIDANEAELVANAPRQAYGRRGLQTKRHI